MSLHPLEKAAIDASYLTVPRARPGDTVTSVYASKESAMYVAKKERGRGMQWVLIEEIQGGTAWRLSAGC